MEIKVIEESKKKLVFELAGEGHSFCGALKKELWRNKSTVAAGYTIKHPLVGIPRMVVETDGTKSPAEVLKDAAKALKKRTDSFGKEFTKVAK